MPRRVGIVLALALVPVSPSRAAAPELWRLEGTPTLLKGEIERLSLDSEGRLRLGSALQTVFDPELPSAWCVARDDAGVLYVGTGNDGRLFRVEHEDGRVLFDAEQLEVHAVAVGPDHRVYAATSPDGAVYAVDEDSPSTTTATSSLPRARKVASTVSAPTEPPSSCSPRRTRTSCRSRSTAAVESTPVALPRGLSTASIPRDTSSCSSTRRSARSGR
jgi:hypothetical protein